jgi:hypothetical protein
MRASPRCAGHFRRVDNAAGTWDALRMQDARRVTRSIIAAIEPMAG